MMLINGWEIDIATLPGPHNSFLNDNFDYKMYISKSEMYSCLVYDIAEIAMGWEVGRIAIFKNKKKPELILNPDSFLCLYSGAEVQYSNNENVIFISQYIEIDQAKRIVKLPFCVIDIEMNRFSYIDIENSTAYEIFEISEMEYSLREKYRDNRFISKDGIKIDFRLQDWHGFQEINNTSIVYNRQKN